MTQHNLLGREIKYFGKKVDRGLLGWELTGREEGVYCYYFKEGLDRQEIAEIYNVSVERIAYILRTLKKEIPFFLGKEYYRPRKGSMRYYYAREYVHLKLMLILLARF